MRSVLWLVLLSMASQSNAQVLKPERISKVELSNTDMNRVVCENGPINDIFFSQEKWIETHSKGRNGFIKFNFVDDGMNQHYVSKRSEFYIVCDGEVYTLMVSPKAIPGVTLTLSPGKSDQLKKSVELFGSMPFEKRILELTKRAYLDQPGEGIIKTRIEGDRIPIRTLSPLFDLTPHQTWSMEGMGIVLTEYLVTARAKVTLSEKALLKPELGSDIHALTITQHELSPRQVSRLLVVHKRKS